jgi:hypothetical protein
MTVDHNNHHPCQIVTSAPVILMEQNTLLRLFDDAHDNLLHPQINPYISNYD